MYFDHAATTQVSRRAIDAMVRNMADNYGNPSSLHALGLRAEREIKQAREHLAQFLEANSKNLFFTSGATESSNLVLKSIMEHAKPSQRHMITTKIEHPSVLEVFKAYERKGFEVTYLPCDHRGVVSAADLSRALKTETFLVSIMMVNNEIGGIQPIQDMCAMTKRFSNDIFFHTDAVQAMGKCPVSIDRLGVDAASFSAHKLHGPKGIGLLYVREPHRIHPLQVGGGQENHLRSGTENVPGIIGFYEAIADFQSQKGNYLERLALLKAACTERILSDFDEVMLLSPMDSDHSHAIVSVAFKDVKSEVIVHELEKQGVYVSSGSACASNKKHNISHVIQAMKVPRSYSEGVIRLSFSGTQTLEALMKAMDILKETVKEHRMTIKWRRR